MMSFELQWILETKRAMRGNLAARPVAGKPRMLDALRERELAVRGRAIHSNSPSGPLRETPVRYRTRPE